MRAGIRRGARWMIAVLAVAAVAPAAAAASPYSDAVMGSDPEESIFQPASYWRLGEAPTSSPGPAYDLGYGYEDARYGRQVGLGRAGAIANDPDTAAEFFGAVKDNVRESHITYEGPYAPLRDTTGFAFEVWIKPKRVDTVSRRVISDEDASGGTLLAVRRDALVFSRHVQPGHWFYWPTQRGGATPVTVAAAQWDTLTAPPLPLDAWSHVVASSSPLAGMLLYVNGQLAASRPATGLKLPFASRGLTTRLSIGAMPSGWNEFDGTLDELVRYPHGALPADLIARHYRAGIGG